MSGSLQQGVAGAVSGACAPDTGWFDGLAAVEAFEGMAWDRELVAALERSPGAVSGRPIRFYTPSFKHYASPEIDTCGGPAWPAVSVTGPECRLQCDHCRGRVLEPMHPATDPGVLERVALEAAANGAGGMLLTGGSDRDNRVDYTPFLPALARVKARHPRFRFAVHTGLVTPAEARALAAAGVDVAMVDLVGAHDTIRRVYHLRREPAAFEATVDALLGAGLRVVPHVVIGLHYGHLLGEWRALEALARRRPDAVVLVVAMPHYAPPARPFRVPPAEEVARFLRDARAALPETDLLLGCARPPGGNRTRLDAYALMAGLDGVVHPAEGVVELARRLGRPAQVIPACCSVPPGVEGP